MAWRIDRQGLVVSAESERGVGRLGVRPRMPIRGWWRRCWVVAVGGLGVVAGLAWLRCVVTVFESRLIADPAFDPHGYGLIFGTVFAVPTSMVTVCALPWAFPQRHRAAVGKVVGLLLPTVTSLAFVALFTA